MTNKSWFAGTDKLMYRERYVIRQILYTLLRLELSSKMSVAASLTSLVP